VTWPSDRPFNLSEIDHETQRFCMELHKNGIHVDQKQRFRLEKVVTARYKAREKVLVDTMESMGLKQSLIKAIVSDDSPDEDDIGDTDRRQRKPGSYDQIREILYGKAPLGWDLGMPVGMQERDFFTATGAAGTGDKVLRAHLASGRLTEKQRTFIHQLRLYRREKNKILGTTLIPMHRRDEHEKGVVWEDDRVRSSWNSHTVATARLSSSRPNCFTGDTEILTTEGWIRFDALPEGLPVAQWHEDGTINFVEPLGYVEHDAERVINIRSFEQIDLAVTPDHRCLTRRYRNRKLQVTPASEYPGYAQQIQAGVSDGGLSVNDNLLRLVVATQADGSFQGSSLRFGFSKTRKIKRLTEILTALGYDYAWRVRPDGASECYVRGDLRDKVCALLDESKQFQSWVLGLNRRGLDVFTREVLLWDGCTKGNHRYYVSASKANVDIVQATFALSGLRAILRSQDRPGRKTLWKVHVDHKGHSSTQYHEKIEMGPQRVYCVEVPSSFIVVRRNGRVAVTGNCQNLGSRRGGFVKSIFTAEPGRILLGADLSQAHLYITANYWCIESLQEAFANGFDPHVMLAAEVVRQAGGDYSLMQGWAEVGGFHLGKKPAKKSAAFAIRELCKTKRYCGIFGAGVNLKGYGRIDFNPTTLAAVVRSTEQPVFDDFGKDTGDVSLPYLDFSDDQVINFHRTWMETEPDWIAAWEWEMQRFKERGYSEDPIFHRRSGGLSDGKFNEVVNYPILTSEAHVMRLAEWEVRQAFPFEFGGAGTGVISQVHDSIIVEAPLPKGYDPMWQPKKGEALPPGIERMRRTLEECMTVKLPGWPLSLRAEAEVGRTLADV